MGSTDNSINRYINHDAFDTARFIVEEIFKNPGISIKELSSKLSVSVDEICYILMGISAYIEQTLATKAESGTPRTVPLS